MSKGTPTIKQYFVGFQHRAVQMHRCSTIFLLCLLLMKKIKRMLQFYLFPQLLCNNYTSVNIYEWETKIKGFRQEDSKILVMVEEIMSAFYFPLEAFFLLFSHFLLWASVTFMHKNKSNAANYDSTLWKFTLRCYKMFSDSSLLNIFTFSI